MELRYIRVEDLSGCMMNVVMKGLWSCLGWSLLCGFVL